MSVATSKQINFINSLVDQRDYSETHTLVQGIINDILMGYEDVINKKYASRIIEVLLECPKKSVETVLNSVKVEDGSYALVINGKTRFFQVNSPTSGRWDGYTFIREQAGADLHNIRNAKQRNDILEMIANDPNALARYGQELGYCGMCNRELTDDISRAIGIGPVCRSK